MKRLVIGLLLLAALPASAAWKFNPHTGKLDYYESGGPAGPQGPAGDNGATGATGPAGDNGVGVPAGGTTGQILEKIDNTDFNTQWGDPPSAGAHAGTHVTGGGDTIADAVAAGNSGLMSGADKTKVDGIAAGAEVNVNADWSAGSGDAQILNKPTIPVAADTVVSEEAYGTSDSGGIAETFSRSDHTHGAVPLPRLDQIADPNDNTDISLGTNRIFFRFTNPSSANSGAFEIEAVGAYSGDLLHVHQHTGNPSAGAHLVHFEAEDVDVIPVSILSANAVAIEVNKQYKSTLATGTAPLDFASTTKNVNLNADLLDDLSSGDFALAGAGVTGGNSHDHSGGDGAQIVYSTLGSIPSTFAPSSHGNEAHSSTFITANVFNDSEGDPGGIGTTADGTSANAARRDHVHAGDHVNLANKGTNTHAQIDTFVSSKAAASGLASLDAGSLVVQNPTNATATPTASKIVIADGGGKVDGWITAATDAAAGKVELATDAETITGTDTARAVTPANARAAYTPTNIAATPGADHTATGPTTNALNAGGTITIMDLVILNSSSQWVQTDANAAATYAGLLAISLESKTSGQAMKVALPGSFVRDDTWAWTPGAVLYLSETAGQITATQPTTTDAAIRVIGFAVTADVIYFFPSPDWITHT